MDGREHAIGVDHWRGAVGVFLRVPRAPRQLLGRHYHVGLLPGGDPHAAAQNVHPTPHHLLTHFW